MMQMKRIGGISVVEQVIAQLTEAMLNKTLKPGDKIPTEIELSQSLGVGRNSIREAIKILVYLGVLEIRRAEGTFVCEGFSESMIDPMIYGIILEKGNSYDALMELREMMEVGVMNLAMKKSNMKGLETVKEKLVQMKLECSKERVDPETLFEIDNELHEAITWMGQNPLVDKINRVVRTLTHAVRKETVKKMVDEGRAMELFEAHQLIIDKLEEGNFDQLEDIIRKSYFME